MFSPNIDKIDLIKKVKTRRSKLYYIREKTSKQIRRKMKEIKQSFVHKDLKKKKKPKAEKIEKVEEVAEQAERQLEGGE